MQFLQYKDVLFYTWKSLFEITKTQKSSNIFTSNLLELVEKMEVPNDEMGLYFYNGEIQKPFISLMKIFLDPKLFKYKEELVKKWIQRVWISLTNRELSPANHKKLLIILLEKHLSKMHKPTLLTDFLVGSLSLGGAIALLALQGMMILVTKHNL